MAKRTETARSDIDLMVITDALTYPDVYQAVQSVERALTRSVNPTVLTLAEWRAKRAQAGSFAARVAKGPRLFVMGSDDDLA